MTYNPPKHPKPKVTVTLTEWQLELLRNLVRDRWQVLANGGVQVEKVMAALGVQEEF